MSQPPAPPIGPAPEEDPAFNQVKGGIKAVGADKRAHPTAASRAQQAQNAAAPPSDDVAGQAKAAKVDTMDAQQAGSFDKKAFIAAVKTAIEAKSPKTLKEADDYTKSGKAGEVKGDVKGLVGQGKQGQAKDIETATAAEPDTSKAVAKPVTPMAPENQSAPPAIPGGGAAPKPAPPEQLNLEAGKQQANQEMSDAQVSEEQLAQSNEPEFQKALSDKQTRRPTPTPHRVSTASRNKTSSAKARRKRLPRHKPAWQTCTAPRPARWPSWLPTRRIRSRRMRRNEPK